MNRFKLSEANTEAAACIVTLFIGLVVGFFAGLVTTSGGNPLVGMTAGLCVCLITGLIIEMFVFLARKFVKIFCGTMLALGLIAK